jgi:hypothetical protein
MYEKKINKGNYDVRTFSRNFKLMMVYFYSVTIVIFKHTRPETKNPIPVVTTQRHHRHPSRRRVPPPPSRLPPVANAFVVLPLLATRNRCNTRFVYNIIHAIIIDFAVIYRFDLNILSINISCVNNSLRWIDFHNPDVSNLENLYHAMFM